MCEDQGWSKTIIGSGFETKYVPSSVVMHSHDYTFFKTIQRYFDTAHAFKMILGKNFRIGKTGTHYMVAELKYIFKNGPSNIHLVFVNNIAKIVGVFFGIHAHKLPIKASRFLSMHKYYWN